MFFLKMAQMNNVELFIKTLHIWVVTLVWLLTQSTHTCSLLPFVQCHYRCSYVHFSFPSNVDPSKFKWQGQLQTLLRIRHQPLPHGCPLSKSCSTLRSRKHTTVKDVLRFNISSGPSSSGKPDDCILFRQQTWRALDHAQLYSVCAQLPKIPTHRPQLQHSVVGWGQNLSTVCNVKTCLFLPPPPPFLALKFINSISAVAT